MEKQRRMLLTLLPILSLILLVIFSSAQNQKLHIHKHIQIADSACEATLYPQLCISTLLQLLPDLTSKTIPNIISATLNRTMHEIRAAASTCTSIRDRPNICLARVQEIAISDCLELFRNTLWNLKLAISDLANTTQHYHDLETLLSGAMTDQYTCLDGFAQSNNNPELKEEIKLSLSDVTRHVSNSLAMLKRVPGVNKFPDTKYWMTKNGFPRWLSQRDRKLLQVSLGNANYDLMVAKDGTGNFTTITEAVDAAPNSSTTRYVIYIKAGAYFENVEVVRRKTMIMFIGDGIGKSIVKASRNVVDGWTTFRSATVAVVGNGFIAKGITFENSAGPSKHQAVALRSGSDFSAFYQCSFIGYQDTLYVHSLRQFYRDCDVYGTIDFIFGNAAAILQNCNLYARKPNANQRNIFTAQGREDPNQNTGISIINSKFAAGSDLVPVKESFRTYLGRPWKLYSRTVIMKSYIDDLVEPVGWLEWNQSFALATLYYGEYMNRGPGSNTSARVTWPGYRVINSSTEANLFTVEPFIQGSEWLDSTGIPYFQGLT